MDRVFLDANVLFSASYRDESSLARLWQLADVELISSSFAASESARNPSTDNQRQRLHELLARTTIVGEPDAIGDLPQGVTLPEKDVPILLAAICAGATHLLTGDQQHFGPLFGQRVRGVLIQPPAVYLAKGATPDQPLGDRPTA